MLSPNRREFFGWSAATAAALRAPLWRPGTLEPNTVFVNGVILPVDQAFSEHTALAISGNRILAVGTDEQVRAAAGQDARVIDLEGRTVLPGLIEPHMHFALMAGLGHFADVGPFEYSTFEGALAALRTIAASAGENEWVTGRQFDPILLDTPRDLTTRELDVVAPDRPVFVLNASGHIAYVNSRTLALGGITKESEDPPGGEFGRYENGEPNGVLYGQSAFLNLLLLDEGTASRMNSGFVEAGRGVGDLAASLGITTLCDQATGAVAGASELGSYRDMYEGGRMKARIRAYLYDESGASFDEAGTKFGDGDALLRVAGWKVVTDGSNQGFTGRQREPYVGKDSVGLFYVEPDELRDIVQKRAGQGWPISLHGNGDAAIDSILDALAHAKEQGIDVAALRPRIEHCSILHDEQIERMQALGVCPSFLINHVHYWGHVMRDQVFGPEKVQLLDRCAAVEEAGLQWVVHTDSPVSPLGSLHKIRVAVVRDLWKEPDTILAPQERVSVETAIRSVTRNAAWLCHSEDEIGSLEADKLADLVILEDDPRAVDPKAISDIAISETWMDGARVYER